jgi:predicted dehydrogenase
VDKINVGIIGGGGVAQFVHLPIISKLESANLYAIAEVNKNRLKIAGEKYSTALQFHNFSEMLADENVHAIIIATPTSTHKEIALKCLKAKKDVLIEKPVALNFSEAKEISAAAKKYNRIVMVGMNMRFRPDAMLLRSIINSKELGDLFYIRCGWLQKKSSNQKWFLDKKQSGGGVVADLGIVILDLALWMLGDDTIKSVSVQKYNHYLAQVEDSAIGFIRLETGKVINFEVSWNLYSDVDRFNLVVHGTEGSAYLNPFRVYKKTESEPIDYSLNKSQNVQNLFKKSYENELKHFINAVRERGNVISTTSEAAIRMKLLETIYKSAAHGKEINF